MKDKILLSEELSRHIKLKKKGNVFWGKCPFHEEDTPSFVVNDSKRFYYCFGCGAHGDIFKFYSDFLQKDFRETLESLGKDYGIPINFKKLNIATIESQEKIERILDKAKTIYRNNLINNKTALQYLKDRNISSVMMEKFQIGYKSR